MKTMLLILKLRILLILAILIEFWHIILILAMLVWFAISIHRFPQRQTIRIIYPTHKTEIEPWVK